jgi:hypothetical protein
MKCMTLHEQHERLLSCDVMHSMLAVTLISNHNAPVASGVNMVPPTTPSTAHMLSVLFRVVPLPPLAAVTLHLSAALQLPSRLHSTPARFAALPASDSLIVFWMSLHSTTLLVV